MTLNVALTRPRAQSLTGKDIPLFVGDVWCAMQRAALHCIEIEAALFNATADTVKNEPPD